METKIDKGSIKFIFGTKDPYALEEFLARHAHTTAFAFIGRSNVGKSTLINALFGRKAARTSQTPGRTRQVNAFSFNLSEPHTELLLFDLPGHGFAKVSKAEQKNWNILMDTFFSCASNQLALVCLQDARHPEQKSDKELERYLKKFPFDSFLVLNKMDKVKTQREKSALKKSWADFLSRHQRYKSVFQVSALKGNGMEELENTLITYALEKTLR